jgi:hypothetical protein
MKNFKFIGLVLLLLSACSSHPTPLPIQTLTPSATALVRTSTPKPSATAGTGTPAMETTPVMATPTACKDTALNTEWLRDEVPYDFTDYNKNKPIPPNGRFTVSWTLKNTGTCVWDSSYVMAFESGYQMTQSASYPIIAEGGTVAPGQSTIVNVSMAAPQKTGGHQALWRLQSRNGTVLLKFTLVVKVDKGTYSPPASPVELTYKSSCADGIITIRLAWIDIANNEEGYRIYRNSKMLVQLPPNAASVLDAVPGAGKYSYTVVAFNASGEGSANTFTEVAKCK